MAASHSLRREGIVDGGTAMYGVLGITGPGNVTNCLIAVGLARSDRAKISPIFCASTKLVALLSRRALYNESARKLSLQLFELLLLCSLHVIFVHTLRRVIP